MQIYLFKIFIPIFFIFSYSSGLLSQELWSEAQNLGTLNSSRNEFAPSWNKFEKVLYFNSERTGYSNFYISEYKSGKFQQASAVKGELNRKKNNQSYIIFPEENLAYLSTFRKDASRSYLNIFYSRKKKNEWTKPFPLDSISHSSFASHPTLSPDGNFMIFSSTRNSQYKDTDLWAAVRQSNGSWGALYSIDELNSPGNEITPFLASADTLYFASDGQEGPGGFDMFVSVFREGKWQRPHPLYELNSEANESDFILLPSGEGVFASDRPGGLGGLDLFMVKPMESAARQAVQKPELRLEAQPSSISAKNKTLYKDMPITPYILSQFETVADNDIAKAAPLNSAPIDFPVDSIYYYAPAVIARRMIDNPSAILEFITFGASANDYVNKLQEYFSNTWGISKDRIIIKESAEYPSLQNPKNDSYILLNSNFASLFAPWRLKRNNVELIPDKLNFYFDAIPQGSIKEWKAYLYLNDKLVSLVAEGSTVPASIQINPDNIKNDIYYSDSLRIQIIALDKDSVEYRKNVVLNISHSEIIEPEYSFIFKKYYEVFPLMILDPSHLNMTVPFESSLKAVSESFNPVNYAIIDYFSQSGLKTAEAVSARLKSFAPVRTGLNQSAAGNGFLQNRGVIINVLKPEIIE